MLFLLLSCLILLKSILCAPICESINNDQRFDCYPDKGPTEELCIKRGCCWKPSLNSSIPFCYFPKNFPQYKLDRVLFQNDTFTSLSIIKKNETFRDKEILNLTVDLAYNSIEQFRIRIYDPNNKRYEVPLNVNVDRVGVNKTNYLFNITPDPFSIQVIRKSNNKTIFDSSVTPLIYADQFIQFGTLIPNNYLYGIGEHQDSFQHKAYWKRFSMWNHDFPPTKGNNLYGSHPFMLTVENNGDSSGLFLLNSNAMEISLTPYPAVTFTTIGGIIDLFLFTGPSPTNVIQDYVQLVGLPFLPPYFTLGFHLCRWNYGSDKNLREVIERNRAAKIPYDTQWTDIDAMLDEKDWTYDLNRYSQLPEIVQDLHYNGQHYINIIDPAISTTDGYEPYDTGLKNDIFIKLFNSTKPLVGKVWPGETVFPDFTNPYATNWWAYLANKYHQNISFDGLWIDMNEPSNFISGSISGCTNNELDNPSFTPRIFGENLFTGTICPSSQQYLSSHYNLHNMYGHFEAIASNMALRQINSTRRPFVLSRSTFSGTGHYSAHWTGDNSALWEDMYYSIPAILNFNMFGIPMVGADICGFNLNTSDELCTRWMQLGSFYPFMRNHNTKIARDQDPGSFNIETQNIMREALKTRYRLLPYFYSLFYQSHLFGDTVVRPLLFEFPNDINTHSIDKQFLLGSALMITPVLEAQTFKIQIYFPNDTWYDYYTGEIITQMNEYKTIDAPIDKINVYLRSGYIIPLQHYEVTTSESRKNPFYLIVALNNSTSSNGYLYWDDGESINSIETLRYNYITFEANYSPFNLTGSLNINLRVSGYETAMIFDEIIIYGVLEKPNKLTINNEFYENFNYDNKIKTLKIQYLSLDLFLLHLIQVNWN